MYCALISDMMGWGPFDFKPMPNYIPRSQVKEYMLGGEHYANSFDLELRQCKNDKNRLINIFLDHSKNCGIFKANLFFIKVELFSY